MSKIVNKTKLAKTVKDLWGKCKDLNNANITNATLNAAENKITLTKANSTNVDVSLANYARLDRNNDFNGDVSWNGGLVEGNWHIGTPNSNASDRRSLGFRGLTTKNFADGHIASLKVFVDSDATEGATTYWKLWAIKKGTTRSEDTVVKVFNSGNDIPLQVESTQVNNVTHKFVTFPINTSFTDEVYFIVRSTTTKFRVCEPAQQYRDDVVNLNISQPPTNVGGKIDWTANADSNTAIMFLIGRESIGSLSEKIKKIEDTGSQYVKVTDTTNTGGQTAQADKVVKLDSNGKLNANMLPAIDGVVSTVNSQSGAVTLGLTLEDSGLKFKVNNTDINTIEIISDDDIDEIINSLT